MEYRRLGNTGLKVSIMGLGSWMTFGKKLSDDQAKECMIMAYDHGVNFFDNAEAYENGLAEEIMGKVFKETGWSRDSYVLASKVFWGGDKPTQLGRV